MLAGDYIHVSMVWDVEPGCGAGPGSQGMTGIEAGNRSDQPHRYTMNVIDLM